MLKIIEEDVCVTLALPMGPLEVHVASACDRKNKYPRLLALWRRWNLGRTGTPKVGMMAKQILQRGHYAEIIQKSVCVTSILLEVSMTTVSSYNCSRWWMLTK